MSIFCLTGKKSAKKKRQALLRKIFILRPVEKGIEEATPAISQSELPVHVT